MMIKGIPHARKFCDVLPEKISLLFFSFVILAGISLSGTVFAGNIGLIGSQSLKQNLSAWIILDARPKSEWMAGHIPGAISFSWEDYTRTDERGVPYRVWPPRDLSAALGKMGISPESPVVVYGDADKSWGGEGWDCWVLSWLGHKGPVLLLDGGIQAWRNKKLPITQGPEKRNARPVIYKFKLQPYLDISTADLENRKSSLNVIDTRSFLEWIRGHIPGAIHMSWTDLYTGKDHRPVAPDEFKKILRDRGIDFNKPIVYYCTGGIRSGYAWMVDQLSGLPAAVNYEGGFEAWEKLSGKH
jgi:thiosulfate/3-mercaptopyruvate sulfurtransferase